MEPYNIQVEVGPTMISVTAQTSSKDAVGEFRASLGRMSHQESWCSPIFSAMISNKFRTRNAATQTHIALDLHVKEN